MDNSAYAGPFAYEFNGVGANHREQSMTKRPQLPVPSRRPSGPRQAFRLVQRNTRPVPLESASHIDDSAHIDVIPTSHTQNTKMDIDPSCLDALDNQLLVSPIDSFVDLCWAEAVTEHDSDLGGDSPTLYNALISTPEKVPDLKVLDDYHDLDPLSPDHEKWYREGIDEPVNTYIEYEQAPEPQKRPIPPSEPSLSFWEPHFRITNPNETIHGFPSRPPKGRRRRKIDILAGACSHFPSRLVRSVT